MSKVRWRVAINAILGAMSACGFMLFMIPWAAANVINIGNVTGMFLCGALFLYALFADRVNGKMAVVFSKKTGRAILSLIAVFAALVLILACIVSGFMLRELDREPSDEATVVVLGCKVNGTLPSLMLRERLDAAYEYLVAHPQAVCVVSGGMGSGEDISEAAAMYRYLTEKGIEKERLYCEDRSTSTRENLEFSLQIIRKNNLNETLAIVTNEFHLYRAGCIAGELGLSSYSVPAPTEFWLLPTYWVREMYAVLYEWIQ